MLWSSISSTWHKQFGLLSIESPCIKQISGGEESHRNRLQRKNITHTAVKLVFSKHKLQKFREFGRAAYIESSGFSTINLVVCADRPLCTCPKKCVHVRSFLWWDSEALALWPWIRCRRMKWLSTQYNIIRSVDNGTMQPDCPFIPSCLLAKNTEVFVFVLSACMNLYYVGL